MNDKHNDKINQQIADYHDELEMLTVHNCAEHYKMSAYTLRRLSVQGKVTSVRVGATGNGKLLISRRSLECYLNGKR